MVSQSILRFIACIIAISLLQSLLPSFIPCSDCIDVGFTVDEIIIANLGMSEDPKFRVNAKEASDTTIMFTLQRGVTCDGNSTCWNTLSFAEVISLWKDCPTFARYFTSILAEVPFSAFFWESEPVSPKTKDRPYRFVVVDAPRLATVIVDGSDFDLFIAEGKGTTTVVSFYNLGRDALLITPCQATPLSEHGYAHLAAFVRNAPEDQAVKLWGKVGASLEEILNSEGSSEEANNVVWVSTSGLGVFWVHVRLDSRPKYYTYRPFRATP
ncbi:unnamed protein product [Choristocarpus tenellus]